MNKVIACIDGAPSSLSVCDYAIWLARRLDKPLVFLHVIEHTEESGAAINLGGSVAASAAAELLARMSELDQQRDKLAHQHGALLLEQARSSALTAGLTQVETMQHTGGLQDVLVALQPDCRMLVMGRHHKNANGLVQYLDHSVERAVRALSHPVFVAGESFVQPQRFMIAFDASATGRKIVQAVTASPVLQNLPAHLVTVGAKDAQVGAALDWATGELQSAGREIHRHTLDGEPEIALPAFAREHDMHLLVMGAYGHSRIRHLIVGSVTTTVLRTSTIPVVVLR